MKYYEVKIKIPAECKADLDEVLEMFEEEHPFETLKIKQVKE